MPDELSSGKAHSCAHSRSEDETFHCAEHNLTGSAELGLPKQYGNRIHSDSGIRERPGDYLEAAAK